VKPMSPVVRTVANSIYFFVLIFGLYIIMHGHLSPGGGFQGGAVIASSFAMILVAHGTMRGFKLFKKDFFSLGESGGLFIFLCLAFAGIGTAFFFNALAGDGGLFGNDVDYGVNLGDLNTAGFIPLMNIAVGLEVLSAFGVILMSMFSWMKMCKEDQACDDEGVEGDPVPDVVEELAVEEMPPESPGEFIEVEEEVIL